MLYGWRLIHFFLILSFFGCWGVSAEEGDTSVREYLLKAKVIHSITRFITWPSTDSSSDFQLCVLGEKPQIFEALNLIYQHEGEFNNRKTSIRYVDLENADGCDVVFIAELSETQLKNAITQLSNKPLLICADSEGYAEQGVHVNLYVDNNKIRFEVNFEASKKSGLGLSSKLLRLAKIVKSRVNYDDE